ncbi:MAG TPA: TonB-dependent receptor [Candidatus Sulfotelmatobacter sp.]|nr:TonB-dependent receptor [Candidatus Sulfotelmatobacter sp.]
MPLFPCKRLSFLLVCLVTSSLAAFGQTGTTSLHGTVYDKSHATVAGARVILENKDQGLERETVTPTSGEFEFLALPPGDYSLTVDKREFSKYQQTGLQLLVNNPMSLNITLDVSGTTTKIEVSGEAPVINTTDASLGIAFGENQVRELPLEGRNVPDLLTLQPGVAYTGNRADTGAGDTRSGAVNGGRSDQGNVTLDGVRVNDEGGHAFTSVLPVTLDSVQEFRVTTTNSNADEGGTSGAQIALVTKSGTNALHGSAYEYHRNTYTSANDYFNKLTQITNCTLPNPNDCNQAPKLIRNIFGASIGGPIKKDRLFFFVNYEGTRRAEETVSSGEEVPSLSMRDGVLFYQCDHTSLTVKTDCPGGFVTGLSQKQYPIPAPVTVQTSTGPETIAYTALSPLQLQQLDPAHAGPDAASMAYFNSLPVPNSKVTGDGFNYQGFVFASPTHETQNVYIARADYNITQDGKQRLSLMGALRNDASDACGGCQPYFPGQLPQGQDVYYNKGLIANYSALIRPSLISNFRYGFVRESFGTLGNSQQPWIIFNFTQSITRTHNFQRPTHNFSEDLSWVHGNHTLQFGGYLLFMRNPRFDFSSSFDSGGTNSSFTQFSGFADKPSSGLDPTSKGFPNVDPAFAQFYDYPITDLFGVVTNATSVFNYDRKLNLLPPDSPILRRYAQNSFEPYIQDVWKIRPNLTLTLGLRYSLFSPIWETNGLQVCPSPSLGKWFNGRASAGANGVPSNQDPLLQVDWCGPANGKGGYWSWDYGNLGPHVAFAWAPNKKEGFLSKILGSGKSSIRGGFGMVYDRFGQGIVDDFNGNSFGLSTSLTTGGLPLSRLPRLTDVNTIPPILLQSAPPAPSFPEVVPTMQSLNAFNFGTSLDTSLKTPYSYTLDFAVERDLGGGFSLDVAYVGRLSHRLLSSQDVAQPLDLRDKKSGLDYYSAIQPLTRLYEFQGVTDATFDNSMVSPKVVQYWNDMLQAPINAYALGAQTGGCGPGGPASTTNPVLAIFDLFCGEKGVETTALQALDGPFADSGFGNGGIPDANNDPNCDKPGFPACRQYYLKGGPYAAYNPQYVSLFTLRSIGFSNYNALQASLRHRMSHGVQFDFNYTYSKSIDLCSDAERVGNNFNTALNFSGGCQIFNAWSPNLFRAVSDFDTTHQLNANWLADLPFGRGHALASNIGRGLDALIGGWRLSGLFRWTSGFPYTIFNNAADYPTDWFWEGAAMPTASHLRSGAYRLASGVNLFPDPSSAQNFFRPALPGEVGVRNFVRGDGFFGVDLGLSKRWNMPWSDKHVVAFRWEVFNVTNSARFDFNDASAGSPSESNNAIGNTNFGNYTHLMTNPRVMQFALRYEF